MSGFELIARVLQRLEVDLSPRYGDGLDPKLREGIAYLQKSYAGLHSSSRSIDYSHVLTQYCYVFKYVAAHADYIYKILRRGKSANRAPLFQEDKIRIACLGGGPGSDMVGLSRYLKFASEIEPVRKVTVDVFDKENDWWPVLKIIIDEFDVPVDFKVNFKELDVSDPSSWNDIDFSRYDLVTASFFVSEICRLGLGQAAKKFWRFVLKGMKAGSLVAFNDNNDERIFGYFDSIYEGAGGFEEILRDEEEVSCGDSFDPLLRVIKRMDHRPRRNGNTAYRLLRKK